MGEGDDLWVFLLVWPLAIIGSLALTALIGWAEAEHDDWGRPTKGGKNLIQSRIYLMLNCASCILIILFDHLLLRDPHQYMFVLWKKYWLLFLSSIVIADVCAILSIFHAFQAQGNGARLARITTPIISILSALATLAILAALSFLYGR